MNKQHVSLTPKDKEDPISEVWIPIKDYENEYMVSNLGRIYSTRNKKILKQNKNRGYVSVQLCKNGKRKRYSIHRLVAQAFIPNPDSLPCINHKDENKANNHVDNLEWCTAEYNNNYGTRNLRNSLSKKGKPSWNKGLTGIYSKETIIKMSNARKGKPNESRMKKVKCITTNENFNSIREAWEKYRINQSDIGKCCSGKRNYAGKHPVTGEKMIWEYID